jgi:ParB-like chromosome segregation protein Spo0J
VTEGRPQAQEPRIHPFLLAQSWRQQMEHDANLNRARIAAREGISRARVTQVMNLLQLPAEIQADLLRPPAPLEIHSFSERSLRVLVSCADEVTQTSRWRQLVQELKRSGGD